jgi:uncharacterized membrane protein
MTIAAGNSARHWVVYALVTVFLWGIWGALAGLSAQHGFPDTLVYCVWSLTMIPPALFVLARAGWKLDVSPRAVGFGMTIGLLGAGGQMLLFKALTIGPAYFIFPIISLSPAITIALSFALLRERTGKLGALGIVLALVALPLFDLSVGQGNAQGLGWFELTVAGEPGPGSLPRPDHAVVRLARALERLGTPRLPQHNPEVVEGFLRTLAGGAGFPRNKVLPLLLARRVTVVAGPTAAAVGAAGGTDSAAAVGITDADLAAGVRRLVGAAGRVERNSGPAGTREEGSA